MYNYFKSYEFCQQQSSGSAPPVLLACDWADESVQFCLQNEQSLSMRKHKIGRHFQFGEKSCAWEIILYYLVFRVTWSLIACRVVALRFCFTCYNEPMRGFEFFMTLHRCIAYMCIGLCVSFFRGSNKGKCHITPPVGSSWTNSPRHLPKNFHLYWLWFEFCALLDRH